ncbi:MAG: glycosyltransferase [Betaproteobacteria bacterium]|nr:glycosyltransferase [Candidatus Dechloromonas phosphorivorans]
MNFGNDAHEKTCIKEAQTNASRETPAVKPIILTFTEFYLPGYRGGGPIRTIANMVEQLSDDFDFHIVTADRDLHDESPYPHVNVDAWNTVGKAKVFYASPSVQTLAGIIKLLRETQFDLLYLNSFFDVRFTLRPLLVRRLGLVSSKPIVLAPRGEFSEGAFKLKRWKKAPFVMLARIVSFYRGITWHASTAFEATDICNVVGVKMNRVGIAADILVAPDLVDVAAMASSNIDEVARVIGPLKVCFLSRISPKKNLDFALRVLAKVSRPVEFNIYGPLEEPSYWQMCKDLIAKLPPHIKVSYGGSIQHELVHATLMVHDLFFLPTHGENFGHVFVEAWSAGLPVLVSDQTPWRGLEQKRLGWDISLDSLDGFVGALEESALLDHEQRLYKRKCCLEFAREMSRSDDALDSNRLLFLIALGRHEAVAAT